MTESSGLIVLGQISGVYGVRGWVKIHSYTAPRENILSYAPWQIRLPGRAEVAKTQEQLFGRSSERPGEPWRSVTMLDGRTQGKGIVAHLEGWDTPEAALSLVGAEIAMPRAQLPAPAKGEYYWSDLIGLQVQGVDNAPLGTVEALMETGANDVLVVQQSGISGKKHLIPYIDGVIVSVDLDAKVLRVDWDIDY